MSHTRLVLLRHGQTEWNSTGRFQGQHDIGLNDLGRQQAREAAPTVASLGIDVIYSSHLSRALDTAREVASVLDLGVWTDERLAEINVGSWVGLTTEEMGERDPEAAQALWEGRDFRRSSTGETASEVGVRLRDCLNELADRHRGQTILCASHGLATRMATGYLLGWDFTTTWRLGAMWNCGWTIIGDSPAGWRLEAYNRVVQAPVEVIVRGEAAD
ncbi:MAG TPA: histidine phosphatase family protein [Propionibacteriaceae bacterium]|nr:histidine phosphatase family protein [Propionibacteriaceae bacterium]